MPTSTLRNDNHTPSPTTPTPGSQGAQSPDRQTPDDRNPPGESSPISAPGSTTEDPVVTAAATSSDPPAPTPDATAVHSEAPAEPREDNAGPKKRPKRKQFSPSQAKTARCVS